MEKAVWSGAIVAAGILLVSTPVFAQQTATGTVTVQVNLTGKAKLELGGTTVSFPDQDPDTAATLTSTSPLVIDVKARTSKTGSVTLSVKSGGDLSSGTDTIGIANLRWTASGSGYVPGTANTSDQNVGTWTGSGHYSGSQTYTLLNSWAYNTGNYSATMTYTLTAP
jgi:hypothetical protein